MRYPNLRYGNPEEMRFYTQGLTSKEIAKHLRRSERSVNGWQENASYPGGYRKYCDYSAWKPS